MAIKVVKKDKAKVLYSRIKNSSGADLTIDGQTLPDGEQVEEGKPNSAGFRFKFIKPRYIETSGNTIVDLMHFGRIPRSQSGYVGLLNEYPGAAFAASVRLLDASYTGGLVRVRAYRVIGSGGLDQGEADVLPDPSSGYFISLNSPITNLDATATGRGLTDSDTLGDLLSSGVNDYDGFVTTWFDQSGNANASQATAANQPKIASAGVLETLNGVTNINTVGGKFLVTPALTPISQPITIFTVHRVTLASGIILGSNASGSERVLIYSGVTGKTFFAGTTLRDAGYLGLNSQLLETFLANQSSSVVRSNGVEIVSGNSGTNTLGRITVGAYSNASFPSNTQMQEAVYYPSDKTADFINIEANINNAFTIYP